MFFYADGKPIQTPPAARHPEIPTGDFVWPLDHRDKLFLLCKIVYVLADAKILQTVSHLKALQFLPNGVRKRPKSRA